MSDKVKICGDEYKPPFRPYLPSGTGIWTVVDSDDKEVSTRNQSNALNELVSLRADYVRLENQYEAYRQGIAEELFELRQEVERLKKLIGEAGEEIKSYEDLECDHSVGICRCGTRALLVSIDLVTGTLVRCRNCNGRGTVGEEDVEMCSVCLGEGVLKPQFQRDKGNTKGHRA